MAVPPGQRHPAREVCVRRDVHAVPGVRRVAAPSVPRHSASEPERLRCAGQAHAAQEAQGPLRARLLPRAQGDRGHAAQLGAEQPGPGRLPQRVSLRASCTGRAPQPTDRNVAKTRQGWRRASRQGLASIRHQHAAERRYGPPGGLRASPHASRRRRKAGARRRCHSKQPRSVANVAVVARGSICRSPMLNLVHVVHTGSPIIRQDRGGDRLSRGKIRVDPERQGMCLRVRVPYTPPTNAPDLLLILEETPGLRLFE